MVEANGTVVIREYDPAWETTFRSERTTLLEAVGTIARSVEHIGSTAVPGLSAKPIIDIAVGVKALEEAERIVQPLASIGYGYLPELNVVVPARRYFHKGPPALRTFHLHVVEVEGSLWYRRILFRNLLRAHPSIRTEYEILKKALAARFPRDRASYTAAKASFIDDVVSAPQ